MVSKPEVIQKRGFYITREIAHKQFFLRWPCHAFGQADVSTILGLQEVGILGK
jgi:hypothetical protein